MDEPRPGVKPDLSPAPLPDRPFVPDVPGVYGRGPTTDEAMADATEALEDYMAWLREQGEPAPEPASDAVEVRYADVPA